MNKTSSLFFRFMLIIVLPFIILQSVTFIVFYNRHWSHIIEVMNYSLITNISSLLLHRNTIASTHPLQIKLYYQKNNTYYHDPNLKYLIDAIEARTEMKIQYISYVNKNIQIVFMSSSEYKPTILFNRRYIESSTTYIFVLWIIFSGFLLMCIALIFAKNQIQSILKLTNFLNQIAKGEDTAFIPSGSEEIKAAGLALINIKEKLKTDFDNQIKLLTYIVHDFRTPLTRIKLHLSLSQTTSILIHNNILHLENIINNYVYLIKNNCAESAQNINLKNFFTTILQTYNSSKMYLKCNKSIKINVPINQLQRVIYNILDNAIKVADKYIKIICSQNIEYTEILISDDGPGIQNINIINLDNINYTEGWGLGLSIAKKIMTDIGGTITWMNNGGTSVKIQLYREK